MRWSRTYIDKNKKWKRLLQRIEAMELNLEDNPNIVFDHAAGLISTVTKTILIDYKYELKGDENLSKLLKNTLELNLGNYEAITESEKESIKKIINGLVTIVQSIGELRNKSGYISHGQDIFSEDSLPILSKTVLKATDIVVGFLLQVESELNSIKIKHRIFYIDNQDFNNWFDENNDNIIFGETVLIPSEVLFNTDIEAYKMELNSYLI